MKIEFGKNKKKAFGIFQDGLKYQLAELELSNDTIIIKNLEEIVLPSPYYENNLTENIETENFDLDVDGELNMSDIGNLDSPEFDENNQEQNIGRDLLRHFLEKYNLASGQISSNCEDESISYFQFNSEYFKRPLLSKLKKELLTKAEIKSKDYQLEYILNADQSGLAVVHRGPFELLNILQDINTISSKTKFFYSQIQTNEIALMDIVKNCYDFPEDEYVTLVYFGIEYKVGIVFKNNVFIKTFNIIVPPADPETLRNIIYSKIILEQDNSNIQITQNLLFAGKFVSDEDIEFFQKSIDSNGVIDRINIPVLSIQKDDQDFIDLENSSDEDLQSSENVKPDTNNIDIAKYAIPIALAWKSLQPKKRFLDFNLLPATIVENQKYFKISWHGFLILAAIFYFAFSGTVRNLQIKQEVLQYSRLNYRLENELTSNRALVAKLKKLKEELNVLESNMQKITSIVGNRNQWTYILKTLSEALHENPLSWITSLNATDKEINIDGMTTNKRSIISFANLLPNGKIININKAKIIDQTIWNFSLSFDYPDKSLTDKYFLESIPIPPKPATKEDFIEDKAGLYQEILTIYLKGNYDEAIEKFNDYIIKHPEFELSYNAHYFLGESHYMIGNYAKALAEFKYIFKQGGNKIPDAMMMAGNVFSKTNQKEKAIKTYKELIEKYPRHHLSKVARYKLAQDKYKL